MYPVGDQVAEAVMLHKDLDKAEAAEQVLEMFGLSDPEPKRMVQYPQMSGGMRQRVMIAMALSWMKVLIADNPPRRSMTIQAQILGLMRDLREAAVRSSTTCSPRSLTMSW